jgi:hypothetical protein
MTCPDGEDGEGEYIAGDPERVICAAPVRPRSETTPGHPFWRALSVPERIAVVRWLQRGDARGLLNALSNNPLSHGLRCFVLEGLAGGSETGWKLRIASPATGGAPKKADKAKLSELQMALAGYGGDVATLARALAVKTIGQRARRGRINNPMQAALVGLDLALAYERLASSKQAIYEVADLYGDSEKNIGRLNTEFRKAGHDAAPKRPNHRKRK